MVVKRPNHSLFIRIIACWNGLEFLYEAVKRQHSNCSSVDVVWTMRLFECSLRGVSFVNHQNFKSNFVYIPKKKYDQNSSEATSNEYWRMNIKKMCSTYIALRNASNVSPIANSSWKVEFHGKKSIFSSAVCCRRRHLTLKLSIFLYTSKKVYLQALRHVIYVYLHIYVMIAAAVTLSQPNWLSLPQQAQHSC